MAGKMRAAFLTDKKKFEIREIDIPVPKDDEVLIKTRHVGVCGADVSFFEFGASGAWSVIGAVLGHEPAGEIVETGKNVSGFSAGDKVCIEPGEPCHDCDFCRRGLYNLCPDVKFMGVGTPGTDGAFREYITAKASMVYKLPKGIGTLEGALAEPLAVGFHAAAQSGAQPGMTAVIMGAGCIGLMIMAALKVRGVNDICVVDVLDKRLEKAKELGAAKTVNSAAEELHESIAEFTGGAGADLVFEVTGNAAAQLEVVRIAKTGGTVTMLGLSGAAEIPFDINGLICKELTVKSVYRYRNQYPVVMKALAAGLVDLKGIISDVYPFEDIQRALEHNVAEKKNVIKEVIEFK